MSESLIDESAENAERDKTTDKKNHTIIHGGDIVSASRRYGIAPERWIDLSTGVNPEPYPLHELSAESFHRLPYLTPAFRDAVSDYYGARNWLAISGTQAAIQVLPKLLRRLPILMPQIGYQEHRRHWQRAKTHILSYPACDLEHARRFIDDALRKNKRQHLMVINPNNPTGLLMGLPQLLEWSRQLVEGAYLIVDEAFIDVSPEHSLLAETLPDNVVVLRSFGKFFGLAGIRLGFVFANTALLSALDQELGLWQVNGPAQDIAIRALTDRQWQEQMRDRIASNRELAGQLFAPVFHSAADEVVHPLVGDGPSRELECRSLFISYKMPLSLAVQVSDYFARRGILLRVISIGDNEAILRIGLLSSTNPASHTAVGAAVESFCQQFNASSVTVQSVQGGILTPSEEQA